MMSIGFGAGTRGIKLAVSTPALPFTPTDLSGLQLWLHADDYTVAGGWPDRSGQNDAGRNATQASAPNRPTLNASDASYGGGASVGFASASGQYLVTGTWDAALAQPCTIIVVGKNDGSATVQFYIDGIDANRIVLDKTNATNIEMYAGTSMTPSISTPDEPYGYVMSDPHVLIAQYDGATSSLYLSSQLAMQSLLQPYPTFPGTFGNVGAGSAAGLTIGAAVNTTLPLNGTIREVLVYDRILSISERNQLLAYVASDSGITVADTFVTFDGNSNMYGVGTTLPGLSTAIPEQTPPYASFRFAGWYNDGKSGYTTPMLTADMATTEGLSDERATYQTLVVLETQNDLVQNGGNANPADTSYAATAWANLVAYAAAARAAGFTRIVLCTCLPCGALGAQQANYEALRQATNTLIRDNYSPHFDALADLGAADSPIGTVASTATAYYDATDTVHLTDTGSVQAAIIIGPLI